MAEDSGDQVAQLVVDAHTAFDQAVDRLLTAFEGSWRELTREDWRTLRRVLLQQFDACVPLRPYADPRLTQLVRDALYILSDDDCKLDRLAWRKSARKVLQGELPPAPIDPRD